MNNIYSNHKTKKSIKLQTKLLLSISLTTELVLLFLSLLFYIYISPILINKEIDSVKSIHSSFKEQIDSSLEDLDTISANVNYTNLILGDFKDYFESTSSKDDFRNLLNLFIILNGSDLKADQINIYDLNGNVIRGGIRNNKITVDLEQLPWYTATLGKNGLKYIQPPYETSSYSVSTNVQKWYLSIYRMLSNTKGQKIGFIETLRNCSTIFKPIEDYTKMQDSTLETYIFNETGILIYPYDFTSTKQTKDAILEYYTYIEDTLPINNTSVIEITKDSTNEKEYLTYNTSTYSNWTYVSVLSKQDILEPANRSITFLIPITSLGFFIAIVISYLLSKHMAKPIHDLQRMIHDLKLDTLGVRQIPKYHTYYELDTVYADFEKMRNQLNMSMKELIDLREQELEAKNLALQAQINPHFYYNTLSSIIILSENDQNAEVIQICKNLSQIMRYVTDNTATIVTLKDELDYVEKYLYCMQIRYQDSLKIIISVPPELLDIKLPKFIIQPLVENALKYGIDTIPPWTIELRGEILKDGWQIHIIDNGTGFSDKTLRELDNKFNTSPENSDLHKLHLNGMGLVNVHIRWKIFAKDKYWFKLGNTAEHHGEVIIGMKHTEGV